MAESTVSVTTPVTIEREQPKARPRHRQLPATRYPSDVLRVVLGTALLGIVLLISYQVSGSHLQRNFFNLLNELPHFFNGPARLLSGAAVIFSVAAAVYLAVRRQ